MGAEDDVGDAVEWFAEVYERQAMLAVRQAIKAHQANGATLELTRREFARSKRDARELGVELNPEAIAALGARIADLETVHADQGVKLSAAMDRLIERKTKPAG